MRIWAFLAALLVACAPHEQDTATARTPATESTEKPVESGLIIEPQPEPVRDPEADKLAELGVGNAQILDIVLGQTPEQRLSNANTLLDYAEKYPERREILDAATQYLNALEVGMVDREQLSSAMQRWKDLRQAALARPSTFDNATPLPVAPDMSKPVHVNGYTRKDGTYVAPYTRSLPKR